MQTSQLISQPLTQTDLAALSESLSTPSAVNQVAQNAYLKMLIQMQQAPDGVRPSVNQIMNALAAGAQSRVDTAFYQALAFETYLGGATAGVLFQVAAVIKVFDWVENATSWLAGKLGALATLVYDVGTLNVTDAVKQVGTILGLTSGSVANSATAAVSGLSMLMGTEAAVLAAAVKFFKQGGPSGGGPSASGSSSSSGSRSSTGSSSSQSKSGSTGSTSSSSGTTGTSSDASRKRPLRNRPKKDLSMLGVNSRARLVRTGIAQ